jgi:hypothetical protein
VFDGSRQQSTTSASSQPRPCPLLAHPCKFGTDPLQSRATPLASQANPPHQGHPIRSKALPISAAAYQPAQHGRPPQRCGPLPQRRLLTHSARSGAASPHTGSTKRPVMEASVHHGNDDTDVGSFRLTMQTHAENFVPPNFVPSLNYSSRFLRPNP